MKYQHIFWDWNGTILDDVDVALRSVNQILAERHRPPITIEQYYSYLDTPIRRFYEHLFDLNQVPFEELVQEFNRNYDAFQEDLVIRPATIQKLKQYQQAGCTQVILSASKESSILSYAEQFKIDAYFDRIIGADNILAESKVSRAVAYASENQVDLRRAVMIGDTIHDFLVARKLGIDCVLLASGHQSKADLCTCGVPVFDSMDDFIL